MRCIKIRKTCWPVAENIDNYTWITHPIPWELCTLQMSKLTKVMCWELCTLQISKLAKLMCVGAAAKSTFRRPPFAAACKAPPKVHIFIVHATLNSKVSQKLVEIYNRDTASTDPHSSTPHTKGSQKTLNYQKSEYFVHTHIINKKIHGQTSDFQETIALNNELDNSNAKICTSPIVSVVYMHHEFISKRGRVVDSYLLNKNMQKCAVERVWSQRIRIYFLKMVMQFREKTGVGKVKNTFVIQFFFKLSYRPDWTHAYARELLFVGGLPKETKASKVKAKKDSSSSSSSSSDSSSDEEDFVEDVIKSHNDYRKKHGVQPLKKSKKLNKYAKEWAQTIAKKDKMEHRSSNEHGENIYCAWSSNPKHKIKGGEPVDSWYSEIKDFTYGKEPADLRAGHFTQVVWEDSKEIGVAMARSKSGKIYVVANYSPPGNFVGSFATKVTSPR
ncbi:unnamed protein product, partial [Meganyctiphanes norvegica]